MNEVKSVNVCRPGSALQLEQADRSGAALAEITFVIEQTYAQSIGVPFEALLCVCGTAGKSWWANTRSGRQGARHLGDLSTIRSAETPAGQKKGWTEKRLPSQY
jgi:hypothetical protein